jgi:hypothetical protein
MIGAVMRIGFTDIRERTSEIRASWSPSERRRRAAEGRRRMAELWALLTLRESEPAILAIGAPVYEDTRRIAG